VLPAAPHWLKVLFTGSVSMQRTDLPRAMKYLGEYARRQALAHTSFPLQREMDCRAVPIPVRESHENYHLKYQGNGGAISGRVDEPFLEENSEQLVFIRRRFVPTETGLGIGILSQVGKRIAPVRGLRHGVGM
jgi:hypothetical protein